MTLEIEIRCGNCSRFISWIYDENEGRIQSEQLIGCPGKECTELHEISVYEIDDDND